jgi:hypothetical protein
MPLIVPAGPPMQQAGGGQGQLLAQAAQVQGVNACIEKGQQEESGQSSADQDQRQGQLIQ